MAKKKRTLPKRRTTSSASARRTAKNRRALILTAVAAIVFWAGVWWLLSLRDRGISEDRIHKHKTYETRLFLKEIEIALGTYQKERGTVPPCPSESQGAAVLFEKLLGSERRYLGPRPDRIRHGKTEDEATVIIDPWGDPIRYRSPGTGVTPNPEYDLWSTGGDPGHPRERWITPK